MTSVGEKPDTHIRIASSDDEREAVYRFRYEVYVEELGKKPSDADHQRRRLQDAMDPTAAQLYAEADGEIVASLRINPTTDAGRYWTHVYGLENFTRFPRNRMTMTSRLMVAAPWRGTRVLASLLMAAYRWARKYEFRCDFCNCVPALVEFYEQLGYRRYRDGFEDPDSGYHFPLVLLLDDMDHLRAVRSPFLRAARKLPAHTDTAQWFRGAFPEHAHFANRRLMGSDAFWHLLNTKLVEPSGGVPLLQGLDEDERRRFLNAGALIRCKAGDTIIRTGDVGNEMFVVLEGVAEVFGNRDNLHHSLAVIGPGMVFGEIAYLSEMPRTADVVARSNMELLVMNQQFMQKAMVQMPEVATKVLFNLSLILCERVGNSTRHWLDSLESENTLVE
ncbi:MAG: GNAT family N-acetyltransferase [Gammaproteobacteria bacterium]